MANFTSSLSRKSKANANDPKLSSKKAGVVESDNKDAIRKFEFLWKNYELLTTLNVEVDTTYHNRTSIITLVLGLLLVGYQSLVPNLSESNMIVGIAIATLGLILSVLWYFFEQRNCVYYTGRGIVLSVLEEKLEAIKDEANAEFQPFWTFVPKWVKSNAKWYERFSAPLILRTILPLLFSLTWLIIIWFTPIIVKRQKNEDDKKVSVIVQLPPQYNSNERLDTVRQKDVIKIGSKYYKIVPFKK